MAVSSMTRSYVINTKEQLESFIKAFEESEKANVPAVKVHARQAKCPAEISALRSRTRRKKSADA